MNTHIGRVHGRRRHTGGPWKEVPTWRITVGCVITLLLSLLAASLTAEAQQSAKIPRIGYLRGGSATDAMRHGEALRQGLRDLGYLEGQHLTIETRVAEGHYDRMGGLGAHESEHPSPGMPGTSWRPPDLTPVSGGGTP